VWLNVYNVEGRLVKSLADGVRAGVGVRELRWDLTDRAGRRVARGVYFVRAKVDLAAGGRVLRRARLVVVN